MVRFAAGNAGLTLLRGTSLRDARMTTVLGCVSTRGCGRAAAQVARDVAPDVGDLAVVGAVHAVGAFVLERAERLHEVAVLQIATRVLDEPDCGLGGVEDLEDSRCHRVCILEVAFVACGLGGGVLVAGRTCPDDVKETLGEVLGVVPGGDVADDGGREAVVDVERDGVRIGELVADGRRERRMRSTAEFENAKRS